MRRTLVILLAVAMTITVVAFGAISFASLREHSGRNEHAHHVKPKAGRQQQVPRIDGSVDPSSISDLTTGQKVDNLSPDNKIEAFEVRY